VKLGKDGDEETDTMYDLIGDDSLLDDLYVAGKKNPNGDARPIIKKHMKRFGIREEEDMEESVEYVEYMAKNSGEASKIAAMFRGKTGGGEIHKSGSEVRIDSAKENEDKNKQVVGKYPDTRVMTVETHVSQTKDANQKQKDAKGEKEIIKSVSETVLDMWREAAEKKKKDIAPDMDNIDEKEPKENTEKLKSEIEKKDDEIAMLKQKAETEKAKAVKKETEKMVNPETGEPLLQVGVAYKALRDKMKEESVKKENEEELKKKKMTDTGEKASEIDTKPEIKYEK